MSSMREPGLLERLLRRRDRAEAHELRLDARVRERHEPHARLELELRGGLLRGEERRGGAVGQPRRVPGGHATGGAERRPQLGEPLERRVGAEELVALGDRPAVVREDGHRDDVLVHDAVVPGARRLLLRAQTANASAASFVSSGKASCRFSAVWPMTAADSSTIRSETKRGLKSTSVAHRVVAHVLDAADEDDVGGAHRDLSRSGGGGGERAGAHAVDGEARNGLRQPGEQRDVATEGQALVADLRRRGEHDVVDPLGRQLRVAPQQLAHDLDGHVVGARAPEVAVLARAAERRAHAVDVDDLAELPSHRGHDTSWVVAAVRAAMGGTRGRARERVRGRCRAPSGATATSDSAS